MIDYINSHLSGFWIALGFALLAAEVLLFGFTTIVFLFAGIGALVTGILMSMAILPETWIAGTACFGITTGISSAILWKPLQAMQKKSEPQKEQKSDFVGLEFVLSEAISTTSPGMYRYSGIDWTVELDARSDTDQLDAGDRVTVVSVDVGTMRVVKKD